MVFVLVASFGGPLAALVMVCVLVAWIVRALGPSRAYPSPLTVATLAACAWMLVYAGGVWAGGLAAPRSASDVCGPGDYASPPTREQLLPLSHECVPVVGPARELVPAVVNPLLSVTAAVGGTATLSTLVASRRAARRTGHPQ
jgi:hypothetical protein